MDFPKYQIRAPLNYLASDTLDKYAEKTKQVILTLLLLIVCIPIHMSTS